MRDIRPIRAEEGEDFLRLLCEVFGLDFDRAHNIFFSEPLFDLNRKWALFEGREMVSILTTVGLEFGWGRAIGIAGVATRESRRNEGMASLLLERVLKESAKRGETGALLFAKDETLYAKNGFESLDRVVRGTVRGEPEPKLPIIVGSDEVRRRYDAWSEADPNRLRRDERRWQYWKWTLRVCTELPDNGYVCLEGNTLREAVSSRPLTSWPVGAAEWFGLTFMADQLGIQLADAAVELYLMGRNIPGQPQMFMTDQF